MSKHALLKAVRTTHLYFGVFIAPALLFFAFTGFLQTFSLHETTKGSSYRPPYLFVRLASIHKHAALPEEPKPDPKPPKGDAPKPDKPASPPPTGGKNPPPGSYHWPEKLFFGIVSIGLITSTLTGLYMAWKFSRRKMFIVLTFLAGAILPLILLPF
jgi:hypothetical protein